MFSGLSNISGAGDIIARVKMSGVNEATAELGKLDKKVAGSSAALTVGLGAVTAAATAWAAILVKSTSMAADFQAQMANVNTLLNVSEQEFNNLSAGVLKLYSSMPTELTDLTKGLYDLVSAGIDSADSLDALELASMAATAGVASVKDAVNAGMSTLNAYGERLAYLGDTNDRLNAIYDIQFSTVKKGVVTFGELSSAIGNVLPSASQLNIGIEELYGSLAYLTKVGIDAQSATTYMARAFESMIEHREEWEALGVEIFNADGAFRGISTVIGDLASKLKGATAEQVAMEMQTLNLNARAKKAIAAMIANYDEYIKTVNEVADSHGSMTGAYEKQMETVAAQWKIFTNQIEAAMVKLGSDVLPPIIEALSVFTENSELLEFMTKMITQYSNLSSSVETTSKTLGIANAFFAIFKDQATTTYEEVADLTGAVDLYNRSLGKYGLAGRLQDLEDPTLNMVSYARELVNNFEDENDAIEKLNKTAGNHKSTVRTLKEIYKDLGEVGIDVKNSYTEQIDKLKQLRAQAGSQGLTGEVYQLTGKIASLSQEFKESDTYLSGFTDKVREFEPTLVELGNAAEDAGSQAGYSISLWDRLYSQLANGETGAENLVWALDSIVGSIPGVSNAVSSLTSTLVTIVSSGFNPLITIVSAVSWVLGLFSSDTDEATEQVEELKYEVEDIIGMWSKWSDTIDFSLNNLTDWEDASPTIKTAVEDLNALLEAYTDWTNNVSLSNVQEGVDLATDIAELDAYIASLTAAIKFQEDFNSTLNNLTFVLDEATTMYDYFGSSMEGLEGVIFLLEEQIGLAVDMASNLDVNSQAYADLAYQIELASAQLAVMNGQYESIYEAATAEKGAILDNIAAIESQMSLLDPLSQEYANLSLELEKAYADLGAINTVIENTEEYQALQAQIESLTSSIAETNAEIDSLIHTIWDLESQKMTIDIELNAQVAEKEGTIEELGEYLWTLYDAIDSADYANLDFFQMSEWLAEITGETYKLTIAWEDMLNKMFDDFDSFESDLDTAAEAIEDLLYFGIDLDTTNVDEQINAAIFRMKDYLNTLTPGSEAYDDAKESLDALIQQFVDMGGVLDEEAALQFNIDQATGAIEEVQGDIDDLYDTANQEKADIDADISAAQTAIDALTIVLDEFVQKLYDLTITADTSSAETSIAAVEKEIGDVTDQVNVFVDVNDSEIQSAGYKIDYLSRTEDVFLNMRDYQLDQTISKINQIPSYKEIAVFVNYSQGGAVPSYHAGGWVDGITKAHAGLYNGKEEQLIMALKDEYILRPAIGEKFGKQQLDTFNATLDPGALKSGRSQIQQRESTRPKISIEINEATPRTYYRMYDQHLNGRRKENQRYEPKVELF